MPNLLQCSPKGSLYRMKDDPVNWEKIMYSEAVNRR